MALQAAPLLTTLLALWAEATGPSRTDVDREIPYFKLFHEIHGFLWILLDAYLVGPPGFEPGTKGL